MNTTNNVEYSIIEQICKAWNNLDVKYLGDYLTNDFIYSSQIVMTNINGSENYIAYLKGKFKAIREGKDKVTAEIGYWNSIPCLILIQLLENEERAVYQHRNKISSGTIKTAPVYTNERGAVIIFEFYGNKVNSACMCVTFPNINQVKRTGVFPI